MEQKSFWVFDQPLSRDPLFLLALALGALAMANAIASADRYGAAAFVITLATAIPFALLIVGIVFGSLREFLRGRRANA